MIKAKITKKEFGFKRPATTSRGTLLTKQVFFIVLHADDNPFVTGIGECSLFPGLSADDVPGFEETLHEILARINSGEDITSESFAQWPSINFALETAYADLMCNGSKVLFPSEFTRGNEPIPINGLIWMDDKEGMRRQIAQKLDSGFRCLKLKIGAIDFEEELGLLRWLRMEFSASDLTLRADANGAFGVEQAPMALDRLAQLRIHSIEQPIRPRQHEEMAKLCRTSPVPIALDEELIGIIGLEKKKRLLECIRPQYIIIKPGLLGGICESEEWISIADALEIGWWVTSSLETNIGLSVIAQWTFTKNARLHQGLSTGNLFEENIPSPLTLTGENLYYSPGTTWDLSLLLHKGKQND